MGCDPKSNERDPCMGGVAAVMGEGLHTGRGIDPISTYFKDEAGQISHF